MLFRSKELPHLNDPFISTRYRNARKYVVDMLVPNRGSDDHQSKPARMKALGGCGAQPLRHLDFLIHQPERSVLLYKGGIPVTVPRAERYAVHKIIVAASREDQVKSAKDILQASTLIEALTSRRPKELGDAWATAWDTGPKWREKLEAGRQRLTETAQVSLASILDQSANSVRLRRRSNKK